jgi:hypothetical protein
MPDDPIRDLLNRPAQPLRTLADIGRLLGEVMRLVEAGANWVAEHDDEIRRFLEHSRGHLSGDWEYLIRAVGGTTGMTMALALEAEERLARRSGQRPGSMFPQIIDEWIREPQLLDEVRDALERTRLALPQKKQLTAAGELIKAGEWELAVPLLIVALEGAFWWLGEQRQLVVQDRKRRWRTVAAPPRQLDSVEALFPMPVMVIDPPLRTFLVKLVYGNSGNAFRHGTAASGYHERALCLYVGLIAWLGAAGELDARGALRDGVRRAQEAQRIAREAEAA